MVFLCLFGEVFLERLDLLVQVRLQEGGGFNVLCVGKFKNSAVTNKTVSDVEETFIYLMIKIK